MEMLGDNMNLLKKYLTMFRQDMKEVMSRRCGLDELNNLLVFISILLLAVALFAHKWIIILLGIVFALIVTLRAFSKNLDDRSKENEIYMKYLGGVVKRISYVSRSIKMKIKTLQDEQYVYFICSGCRQTIRLPKNKGTVSVRCPKCGQNFIKKT